MERWLLPCRYLGLFSISLALMVLRVPERFTAPNFFADEGLVYFQFAYSVPWYEALLTPHKGYYSFWANLAATLAAHAVPLEWAAYVTLILGTLVLIATATLVSLAGSPFQTFRQQGLAVLLLILVPPGYGRLNTNFSHFYFCVCAALILVSRPVASSWITWLRRVTLACAGLSSVPAVFLTPLYWWRSWKESGSREDRMQTRILTASSVIQFAVFLWQSGASTGEVAPTRWAPPQGGVLLLATANNSLVHPFGGWAAMKRVGEAMQESLALADGSQLAAWTAVSALGLLAASGLMLGLRARPSRPAALLFTAYWLVVGLSLLAGNTGDADSKAALITSNFRYFTAPNMIMVLALVLHVESGSRWRRRACWSACTWLLTAGIYTFFHTPGSFSGGPAWSDEVERWRADPSYRLKQWPEGWDFPLPPRRVLAPPQKDE